MAFDHTAKYALRQLGEFRNGANFKQDDYHPAGLPIVNVKQLYRGRFVNCTGLERLKISAIPNPDKLYLKQGDILFARSSVKASGAGQVSMISSCDPQTVFSGFIIRFRPTSLDLVIPEYLNYLLRSPEYREYLTRIAVGTTIVNLSQDTLGDLEVELPPRNVQEEVVGTLSSLDNKMDLLRQTNATFEAIAQTLFKSWFVDFDPVRAKMEGRDPEGLPPEVADLFPCEFEESELGAIPKGWRQCTLDDACEVNPTRRIKKGTVAPYLEMSALQTRGHRPDAPVLREFSSGTKFVNGDSLLARITPCLENGKTAFVDFLASGVTGWGSTEYIVVRPKAPLPPYWGYLLCRHEPLRQFAIQAMAGTSGRQRVEVSRLSQFRVAVPQASIAKAFAEAVEPIQQRIAANDDQAKTLATLRDALLPRLMSGKLRIPDVEEVLA